MLCFSAASAEYESKPGRDCVGGRGGETGLRPPGRPASAQPALEEGGRETAIRPAGGQLLCQLSNAIKTQRKAPKAPLCLNSIRVAFVCRTHYILFIYDTKVETDTLVLERLTREEAGTYQCVTRDSSGLQPVTKDVEVTVECKWRFYSE